MKNYFVIHALGNTAEDYWYSYIKKIVESGGGLASCQLCHQ